MKKLLQMIHHFSAVMEKLSCLALALLVLLTVKEVILRYFFQQASMATQELQWHLFGLVFLFAIANTYRFDRHVRVDIYYAHFSPKAKKRINLFTLFFSLWPTCFLVIYYGLEYAFEARQFGTFGSGQDAHWWDWILQGEQSANPGGLPGRWLIKLAIPISFFSLALQGLSQLKQNLTQE